MTAGRSVRRLLLGFVLAALAAGLLARAWAAPLLARVAFDAAALPVVVALTVDLLAALRRRSLGVDVIALLAILGALALGEHLVAAIVALMVSGGTALEEFAEARARRELAALLARTPRVAHRYEGEAICDVAVGDVRAGDRLLVKPGEIVTAGVGSSTGSGRNPRSVGADRRAAAGRLRRWRRRGEWRSERRSCLRAVRDRACGR